MDTIIDVQMPDGKVTVEISYTETMEDNGLCEYPSFEDLIIHKISEPIAKGIDTDNFLDAVAETLQGEITRGEIWN